MVQSPCRLYAVYSAGEGDAAGDGSGVGDGGRGGSVMIRSRSCTRAFDTRYTASSPSFRTYVPDSAGALAPMVSVLDSPLASRIVANMVGAASPNSASLETLATRYVARTDA